MVRLTPGTIEYLVVDVTDRLNGIQTLVGTNPVFDVRVRGASGWVFQDHAAGINVMQALCLVDTTGWAVGTYELFLKFTELPEHPRLGPLVFEVA